MQIERIYNQDERLDHKTVEEIKHEWSTLLSEIRHQMENDVYPKDPKIKELAKRWKELDKALSLGGLEVSEIIKNDYKEPFNSDISDYDFKIKDYISLALSD